MHSVRLAALAFIACFMGACATESPSGPPLVLSKLEAKGIDSRTYAKIANGRVLTYNDIYGLLKKNIPGKVITDYLKSTRAPYKFTDAQINRLIAVGAGNTLISYLGQSSGVYVATARNQTGPAKFNWMLDPYYTDPYFMGAPPFAWGFPDEWYSPAYANTYFP